MIMCLLIQWCYGAIEFLISRFMSPFLSTVHPLLEMSLSMKKTKFGIMTKREIRERVIAIASGELEAKIDDPKIWVTDINAISKENITTELCDSFFTSEELSVSEDFVRCDRGPIFDEDE